MIFKDNFNSKNFWKNQELLSKTGFTSSRKKIEPSNPSMLLYNERNVLINWIF